MSIVSKFYPRVLQGKALVFNPFFSSVGVYIFSKTIVLLATVQSSELYNGEDHWWMMHPTFAT